MIEDDPLVRVPIAQGLDAAGFVVIGAANGPEALEILDSAEIDIAVVDIALAGRMDGVAVLREARRSNPNLKAILVSGRAPAEDVSALGAFLAKPFRLTELMTLIDLVLSGPACSASATPPASSRPRSF